MSTHPKEAAKEREDLTGREFDRWTVLSDERDGDGRRVLCRCKCGIRKFVDVRELKRHGSKGCRGCSTATPANVETRSRIAAKKPRAPAVSMETPRWLFERERARVAKPGTFTKKNSGASG